ncbi:MAG: hypothetical protein JWM10_3786 [Myxococcaceae bacterium]|nr:hypothetical protein [Myxococcaceae bacterium]
MPSKEVTDRQKSARAVAAAAEAHAAEAAAKITAALEAHLSPGERMPDVALLLRLFGRAVVAHGDLLARADLAHEKELSDDAGPRRRRDEGATALYQAGYETRDLVASHYGDEGLAALSMGVPAPADPTALVHWVTAAVERLHDAKAKLPAPRRKAVRVDRKALGDELAAGLPALTAALKDVDRERREADATLAAKGKAMEGYDAAFRRGAGALTAMFRAAGLDDLAAKVRPSGRRPGQTAEGEPTPDAPTDPVK